MSHNNSDALTHLYSLPNRTNSARACKGQIYRRIR